MKKSILSIAMLFFIMSKLFAVDGEKSTLTVTIKNLQSKDGKVSITLFDHADNFLKKGVQKSVVIGEGNSSVVVFENLPNGIYAASTYHDKNGNGDLDTGVFGIPEEPYGFSNDARGTFGPATFDDSKFSITEDKSISITIK